MALKTWKYVKTKIHDISGLDDNPEYYMYQLSNGIFYPAIRKIDYRIRTKVRFSI